MRRPDRYEHLGDDKYRAWFGSDYVDVTLSRERDYPGLRWDCIHLPLYEMAAKILPTECLVFEAGCGSGYGALYMARTGCCVDACDVCEDSLRYARLSRDTSESRCNLFTLDLDLGVRTQLGPFLPMYDAIVAVESIEHIDNDALAVSEFFSTTKPGGHLFITTPERAKDRAPSPFHIREYGRDEFRDLIESAGWRIEQWLSHRDFQDTMIVHARKPE